MDDISIDKVATSVTENQTTGRSRKLHREPAERVKEKIPEYLSLTKRADEEAGSTLEDIQQGVSSEGISIELTATSHGKSARRVRDVKKKVESSKSANKLKTKSLAVKQSPAKKGKLSPIKGGKKVAKTKPVRGKSAVVKHQVKKTIGIGEKKLRSRKLFVSKTTAEKKQKMKSPAKKKVIVGKGMGPKSAKTAKSKKASAK
ncbi:hypothetical protein NPIL_73381 [Nephila pilipes]|uniref:Uncharacterized protein n=1 Tax=Nephila pilipes TaxID=299642 RepID=A0A8X6PG66_NEPPI|nr:hypothetical protein NPIL_73381 [Nephila pilipes]